MGWQECPSPVALIAIVPLACVRRVTHTCAAMGCVSYLSSVFANIFLPTQASQLGLEIGIVLREIEEAIETLPVIPPPAGGPG